MGNTEAGQGISAEDLELLNRYWDAATGHLVEGVAHTVIADNAGGQLMQHGQVDLVVTDVVMLGMNGTALADRLTAEFPHIAVVLMSAFAPPGLSRVGFRDAIVPVLQKPFKPSHLEEIVQMTLRRRFDLRGTAAGGEG